MLKHMSRGRGACRKEGEGEAAGVATEDPVERMTEGVCLNKTVGFLHGLP